MSEDLDLLFGALANEHRREIVRMLALQPFAIHQLAEHRRLSLPAIHKHIKVLERAGLVHRKKLGRTNILAFRREGMMQVQAWAGLFHTLWGTDLASFENYADFVARSPNPKNSPGEEQ